MSKCSLQNLSPATQNEIRRRTRNRTTTSEGNIAGEENIGLDDIGDPEEDAELREEGDTGEDTADDEDEDMRRAREESRTKSHTDAIRRQEMARGAGSSGTHHDDMPPPPQPQPDQNLLLGQILSQLQEMNITAEARWQQQLEWQRLQDARWEEWYHWRNNQFPPPPPPQCSYIALDLSFSSVSYHALLDSSLVQTLVQFQFLFVNCNLALVFTLWFERFYY